MRLIDADELIKKLEFNSWDIEEWELPHEQVSAGLRANAYDRKTVEDAPTIDAVPVIRCKDCKWWSPNRKTCTEWADYCFRESKNCILTHFSCRESDYCSWARTGRKEE